MHFALEEAYGYFEDPVAVAPHLNATACALRDEHSSLYSSICDVLEFVESEFYAGRLVTSAPQVVILFRTFYDQLQSHEAKENELILKAYGDDIGVGDERCREEVSCGRVWSGAVGPAFISSMWFGPLCVVFCRCT